MSTEALKRFRQRFVRVSMEQRLNLSVAGAKETPRLLASPYVAPSDRVLILGADSVDVLQDVARQVGPDGAVLCLNDDLNLVLGLREQFGLRGAREDEAGIKVVCAETSDFRADSEWLERTLREEPLDNLQSFHQLKERIAQRAAETPLVPEASVNVVILDATSNLLSAEVGVSILREAFNVLERGGRLIVNCLVSDEPLSPSDISGLRHVCAQRRIPTEEELVSEIVQAGFYGVEILSWGDAPLHLFEGVEIRNFTVRAFKGKEGACYDCHHAVIYRGPWKRVHDDDGHAYRRGERTAVCEKTYRILTSHPYKDNFIPVPPYINVPLEEARPFSCLGDAKRDPGVSKGLRTQDPARKDEGVSECGC